MADTEPAASGFDRAAAERMLGEVFAPWIRELDLALVAVETEAPPGAGPDWLPGVTLRMPFSPRLCRFGGIVCGQSLMALADTAMVLAVTAALRRRQPMTTVDQTSHFMRPVTSADVLADARVMRAGRSLSFGRVTLSSAADGRPVALATSVFAML